MRTILTLIFVANATFLFGQSDSITIKGIVTDYDGKPIENAMIMLKGNNFGGFVDTTHSDHSGQYLLKVKKGKYSGLAAVRMEDYGKTRLEFWAWEIPAFKDMLLDIQYDRLEVYGVNVFRVQGAYPGYTIYFRPMSLTRFLTADAESGVMDIAPPADKIDIQVEINGEKVTLNSVQRVEEFAGKDKMYGYLIHTEPGKRSNDKYDTIRILVEDKENGDRGEAIYFKEIVKYE